MAEAHRKLTKEERMKKFQSESRFAQNAVKMFSTATAIVANYCIDNNLPISSLDMRQILDQMLHSILFLGNIHKTKYNPDYIFYEREMYYKTKEDFPNPFEQYKTHVALRTPFSYFLELVTKCYGEDKERKDKLTELVSECEKSGDSFPVISIVICICEYNKTEKYYGASLSCEGDREREIMTAVSCLYVWHPKVSSAVMSVFANGQGDPHRIKLPNTVTCEAYAVEDITQLKPPCQRCGELYSLPGHTDYLNPPGNCAETEAISNLLRNEQHVDDQTTITGGVFEREDIENMSADIFNTNMGDIMQKRKSRNNYNIDTVYKAQ